MTWRAGSRVFRLRAPVDSNSPQPNCRVVRDPLLSDTVRVTRSAQRPDDPPMMSVSDLERVRARDPVALDQFFEALFNRTYGLLFRLTGDRTTAEDLAQETFLKVHRGLHALDPARDPWPWVATIATNVCRDHWGSIASRLQADSRSIDDEPASSELRDWRSGPEDAIRAREEAALVQEALGSVPESARLVVLLHDWQGLGHDEIAQMTGQSHAAVRQQYSRALAMLGKLLRTLRP